MAHSRKLLGAPGLVRSQGLTGSEAAVLTGLLFDPPMTDMFAQGFGLGDTKWLLHDCILAVDRV